MNTRQLSVIGALTLGLAIPAGPAGASPERAPLDLRPASYLRDGQIEAVLTVANPNQTPIHTLHVEAILGDTMATSPAHLVLSPGDTTTVRLSFGPAPRPAGVRTIIFRLHYSDHRGRKHAALTSIPLVTADIESLSGPLAIRLERKNQRTRRWHLHLRHEGAESIDTAIRLYQHDTMHAVTDPRAPLRLDPGTQIERQVSVRRRGAPAEGTPSIVVLDYIKNGIPWSQAQSANDVATPSRRLSKGRQAGTLVVLVLLALWLLLQCCTCLARRMLATPRVQQGFELLVLGALTIFTAWHTYPQGWFMDTLATGGDIPAHNFLASHLKDTLFSSGRIISWSQGWWAGFPMFQYYFPLPYLAVAILSAVIPFNVAFKLVSVAGLVTLPVCAYTLARATRLPRPGPILMATAMIPLLFTRTHEMWGVNIYSTLAGMIGNSIGFSLMLLFMASAWRDADNGQFRIRTALLLSALTAAHFFTTLIAVMATAFMPLLGPTAGSRKSTVALVKGGLLGFALMAWWLVPLVAKIDYSVAFGVNWAVRLHETLPVSSFILAPFVFTAIGVSLWQKVRSQASSDHRVRDESLTLAMLLQWVLLVAVGLFLFGSRMAAVFINIRLWPFFYFAWLALAACGLGWLLHRTRTPELAVAALVILTLSFGIDQPNETRAWARWNYEGAEAKPGWEAVKALVLPLDGTPGRLAHDLHPDNNLLGSTRFFESVPHLIDKPILEGGIVNSAAGSLFSYLVQGATSQTSAGYPVMVEPSTFCSERAGRWLALFNVTHFIARWEPTQAAFAKHPDWLHVATQDGWRLYEARTHDGNYVTIPKVEPIGVRLAPGSRGQPWKQAGLDWIYTFAAIDTPFALLDSGCDAPDINRVVSEDALCAHLAALEGGHGNTLNFESLPHAMPAIDLIEFSDRTIRFRTTALERPHIISVTHFPNWRVSGAKKIYRVTPSFMLVYPTQEEVTLSYGRVASDRIGLSLSWMAWALVAGLAVRYRRPLQRTRKGTRT